MRSFEVVTTFGPKGFEEYGKTMLRTFSQFWDHSIPIRVYADGFDRTLPAWQAEFLKHCQPIARGDTGKGYNFRFDAAKFSHKTAAIIDAYGRCEADVMIWLDADTVTHGPVPVPFLEALFPASAQIAWLDRETLYPECGFVMYRANDPQVAWLMNSWRNLLCSGRIFDLKEWHDSYVFEHLVRKQGLVTHSLSGPEARKTAHPFINSVLGTRMDHLKGPRKADGRSRPRDLVTDHGVEYWGRK